MGSPGTVDDILNFKKDDEDDLYKLLGCDENSTVSSRILFMRMDKNILLVFFKNIFLSENIHFCYCS